MNPAFDMPYLPNPFAAAEEPAPAPKYTLYHDTITIDQRRPRHQVALLEKLCMEKDQQISLLKCKNDALVQMLQRVKEREAKTPCLIADPMGYLNNMAQAQLNGAASGMLNNMQRATLPPEAAPQSSEKAAGSQAVHHDPDFGYVIIGLLGE